MFAPKTNSTMESTSINDDNEPFEELSASFNSSTGSSDDHGEEGYDYHREVSDDGMEEEGPDTPSKEDDDKPMIGSKAGNTNKWKILVLAVMCINTALVITATTLFLKHEENEEFETAVSFDKKGGGVSVQAEVDLVARSLEQLLTLVFPFSDKPYYNTAIVLKCGHDSYRCISG
jgi:hypothetical protein